MIVMQYIVRFFIENFCLSGVIGSIHCFFSQVDNYFPFFAPYLPSPVHCSSFVNILINRKNIRFPSPIHHYKISLLHDSIIELNSSGMLLKDIEFVYGTTILFYFIKVENLVENLYIFFYYKYFSICILFLFFI